MNKIDFAVIIRVDHANPNGDPLNGNRPRQDSDGFGEITDVCLKRKLRDRLQEMGHSIFVQADNRKSDDARSLQDRAEKTLGDRLDEATACETWLDVRAFGQLFAYPKKSKAKSKGKKDAPEGAAADADPSDKSVSISVRGPVTIQSAFSVKPIEITSTQITKSVNGVTNDGDRGSDTMGMKHRVDHAVYVSYGSMFSQLAEKTGFVEDDAQAIKHALIDLFENDASSARPGGSMEVVNVVWWEHDCPKGQYSSAKVHRSLAVGPTGDLQFAPLDGLTPEILAGF